MFDRIICIYTQPVKQCKVIDSPNSFVRHHFCLSACVLVCISSPHIREANITNITLTLHCWLLNAIHNTIETSTLHLQSIHPHRAYHWQYISIIVIDMLSNQVNTSRCTASYVCFHIKCLSESFDCIFENCVKRFYICRCHRIYWCLKLFGRFVQ